MSVPPVRTSSYEVAPPTPGPHPVVDNVQQTAKPVVSPALSTARLTKLQSIVGGLLWYARMVDPTLLEAVNFLATQQGSATEDTMRHARHLLGYASAYPDNAKCFRSSDMVLKCFSDASHNSRAGGRGVQGGFLYAGNNGRDAVLNAPLAAGSSIIDVVCPSATEAEIAAVFLHMQRAVFLRNIFDFLGYPQGPTPYILVL